MNWIIEIAKTLAYALLTSLVFVFVRAMLPINGSKATAFVLVRVQGYSLMLVGFFTIVLGVLLSQLDLVVTDGRGHFILR